LLLRTDLVQAEEALHLVHRQTWSDISKVNWQMTSMIDTELNSCVTISHAWFTYHLLHAVLYYIIHWWMPPPSRVWQMSWERLLTHPPDDSRR
jgi:hypothetical protein